MSATLNHLLSKAILLSEVSDTARLDTELLLAEAIGKDRTYLYTWPEKELSDDQLSRFDFAFQRRLKGEPVAYILGYQDFWSLRLKVSPATLIPRPETELLVEKVLELLPRTTASVADLGTGTGAIALALASEQPHWQIKAVDKVNSAVELAELNRAELGFANVEVLQGSWCEPLADRAFDVIVSNPPYIDEKDEHLSQGDVRFEPATALVAGEQGLADIDAIAHQAIGCLKPNGWLLLEHGCQQAAAVRRLLSEKGYQSVSSLQDLAGLDRVTLGQWQCEV